MASSKELAVFARQCSVMIGAGLPLVECLEILGTQAENRRFGEAILATRADVEAGTSLAEAMRRRPAAFDGLVTNMVAAGEAGGRLDAILARLATYLEKTARLKSQVKAAMVYPATIIMIALLVVAAILWKVIPTFTTLFDGLGAELPLPTRLVIGLSDAVAKLLPFVLAGTAAGWLGFRRYYGTPRGRVVVDRALLSLPVFGALLRKIAIARFCRSLSTLLGSGVSILQALDITSRTSGNAVVQAAVGTSRRRVERGEPIAATLRRTAVFPPMVVQMIGVGESTGSLEGMLAKIADFYEDEVEIAVAALLTVLEPALVALLGGLVGGVVIAIYLPIFGLIGQLAGR
jgi:type IV pilus assembly protein PilC